MIKKVAIYDPYLDTLGGGERYCLTVAEILLKKNCQVDLFWSGDPVYVARAEDRFSLDLQNINIIPDLFNNVSKKIEHLHTAESLDKNNSANNDVYNFIDKVNKFKCKVLSTMQYDLLFFLSDGSIPCLFAKKNILHIQVPFSKTDSTLETIKNLAKYPTITNIVCNSKFTSKHTPSVFNNKTKIIYPPVDVNKFYSSQEKENIILSVGRFDNILNAKKQDILIETFKKIYKKNPYTSWKLVLAGGSYQSEQNNSYLNYLKDISKGFPIEIYVNPSFTELREIYAKSKIYWHAAGYGVNENIHPEETEHFGITIVEAMASGLVPVVVNKGGIPEIVTNGINGYLWDSFEELISKTELLFESPELVKTLSIESQKASTKFSKEVFQKQFVDLIYS